MARRHNSSLFQERCEGGRFADILPAWRSVRSASSLLALWYLPPRPGTLVRPESGSKLHALSRMAGLRAIRVRVCFTRLPSIFYPPSLAAPEWNEVGSTLAVPSTLAGSGLWTLDFGLWTVDPPSPDFGAASCGPLTSNCFQRLWTQNQLAGSRRTASSNAWLISRRISAVGRARSFSRVGISSPASMRQRPRPTR